MLTSCSGVLPWHFYAVAFPRRFRQVEGKLCLVLPRHQSTRAELSSKGCCSVLLLEAMLVALQGHVH